jgi:hypothetical protein
MCDVQCSDHRDSKSIVSHVFHCHYTERTETWQGSVGADTGNRDMGRMGKSTRKRMPRNMGGIGVDAVEGM